MWLQTVRHNNKLHATLGPQRKPVEATLASLLRIEPNMELALSLDREKCQWATWAESSPWTHQMLLPCLNSSVCMCTYVSAREHFGSVSSLHSVYVFLLFPLTLHGCRWLVVGCLVIWGCNNAPGVSGIPWVFVYFSLSWLKLRAIYVQTVVTSSVLYPWPRELLHRKSSHTLHRWSCKTHDLPYHNLRYKQCPGK